MCFLCCLPPVFAASIFLLQLLRLKQQFKLNYFLKLHFMKLLIFSSPLKQIIEFITSSNICSQQLIFLLQLAILLTHVQHLLINVLFIELILQNSDRIHSTAFINPQTRVERLVLFLRNFAPEAVVEYIN